MESPVRPKACRGSFLAGSRESRHLCTESSTESPTDLSFGRHDSAGALAGLMYRCFVLRESKDKLSMVPRQGQTCRGYSYVG